MSKLRERSGVERMIRGQLLDRGITDERLIAAFRAVPRERFFPADVAEEAYSDRATPIGHGQTISQPYIVALMTSRLVLEPTHRVLEIGTGSGYQTAILSRLASEIWTVERIKPLLDRAWNTLMELGVRNAHFRHGDGTAGWPDAAPFDRILITAGAPELPERLLRANLADGGVAVLPVGPESRQTLVSVVRSGDRLDAVEICGCRFVKLIGDEGWSE